ncbi:MAG: hypothetical protein GY943_09090 [Chloroflexi bacterium]|nr:hypothetical protein [Chloroflexota bacterium]
MQEFEFWLPWGFLDEVGQVQQYGRMRLAYAQDEMESMHQADQRGHEAYLPIYLLSRVITQLGNFTAVSPNQLENLYAVDMAYLSDFYMSINGLEQQQ